MELAQAEAWETKALAGQERRFAQARMKPKVAVPQQRALELVQVKEMKAAKMQKTSAERWQPELALGPMEPELMQMQALLELELRKRKPQPRRLLLEQEQSQAQIGRWPRTLRVQVQKKLREPLARLKNNLRPQQSLRAWAALGIAVPMKPRAFPAGGTWLPAKKRLARTKWVAHKQDWQWQRLRRRDGRS